MYVCMYVCVYICVYVYMYVCMYVCMYNISGHDIGNCKKDEMPFIIGSLGGADTQLEPMTYSRSLCARCLYFSSSLSSFRLQLLQLYGMSTTCVNVCWI